MKDINEKEIFISEETRDAFNESFNYFKNIFGWDNNAKESQMESKVCHIINYTLEELKGLNKFTTDLENRNIYNNIPVYKITDVENIPGEIYRIYPKNPNYSYQDFKKYFENELKNDIIEVSNLGRIKFNGILLEQKEKEYKKGYLYVTFYKGIEYLV